MVDCLLVPSWCRKGSISLEGTKGQRDPVGMEHVIIYSVDCSLTRTQGIPSQVVGQHPTSQQNRTFRTCIILAQSRGVPRSNLRLRLGGRRGGGPFEAKGKPRAKSCLSVIPMSKRFTEGSVKPKGPHFLRSLSSWANMSSAAGRWLPGSFRLLSARSLLSARHKVPTPRRQASRRPWEADAILRARCQPGIDPL